MHYIKNKILILLFTICLIPYSLSYGETGVSSNYLFVFIAIVLYFTGYRNIEANQFIEFAALFFLALLSLALIFGDNSSELLVRRLGSFLIFMSMFSFAKVKFNETLIKIIKSSIVLAATLIAIRYLYVYIAYDGIHLIGNAKTTVGTQRIGFLYIVAFWIIAIDYKDNPQKILLLINLIFALLITYSRSSIISFTFTFIVYFSINYKNIKFYKIKGINFYLFITFLIAIGFILKNTIIFYIENLLGIDSGMSGAYIYNFSNPQTSEGYRLDLFSKIASYSFNNVIYGSGYLGVWTLSNDNVESAHNQYLDVLFRVGIFGFLLYCILLYKVVKNLFLYYKSLFYGVVGILIYGIFHETFKLSYGQFILAFYIGLLNYKNE